MKKKNYKMLEEGGRRKKSVRGDACGKGVEKEKGEIGTRRERKVIEESRTRELCVFH